MAHDGQDLANILTAKSDKTTEGNAASARRSIAEAHKHELVPLTSVIKDRIRNIIRRLQSKQYELHLKRKYKADALTRKNFRRSEIVRKEKEAEKAALKKLKKGGGKSGEKNTAKPNKVNKKGKDDKTPKKSAVLRFKKKAQWRENRYRKFRKVRYRSLFVQAEMKSLHDKRLHCSTKPILIPNFGVSQNDQQIELIKRQRLSRRWKSLHQMHQPSLFSVVPKSAPGMHAMPVSRPTETKARLRHLLKTEWGIIHHDRLTKNRLVKAVAGLILEAKDLYDKKQKRTVINSTDNTADGSLPYKGKLTVTGTLHHFPPIPSITKNLEVPGSLKKVSLDVPDQFSASEPSPEESAFQEKKDKVTALLRQDPQLINYQLGKYLLKEINRDSEIRKNVYINRPKTTHDSHLRANIQERVIGKILQHQSLIPQTEPRMPLPFKKILVGYNRPKKILLGAAQLMNPAQRIGYRSIRPLMEILPINRERIKKIRHERQMYPPMKNPHKTQKVVKKKKGKKGDKKKATGTNAKPKASGKPEKKGQTKTNAPPKDPKQWKKWHRAQKRKRRKRKLQLWIKSLEKRRRVKITQDILQEQAFKGNRDLPAMRKKIRQLEEQATRATTLVNYFDTRNQFLKETNKELHDRGMTEYKSKSADFKGLRETWFNLKDHVDQINEQIKSQTEHFLISCEKIKNDTVELEERLNLDLANLETDYVMIMNFIQLEPHWEAEIERMERQPLFYEYLYRFKQSAESSSFSYVCDLQQRIMHRGFMQIAYQERRTLRRQLPAASKRMLDERGLLAQEENKIRIWCNRLQRKQQKQIIPATTQLEHETKKLRQEKAVEVQNRQQFLIESCVMRKKIKNMKFIQPKILENLMNKTQRKLDKSAARLRKEEDLNEDYRDTADTLQKTLLGLQGLVNRDYQKRSLNCDVIMKAAAQLRKAFGLPDDFSEKIWFIRKKSPEEVNVFLKTAMKILSSAPCTKEIEVLERTLCGTKVERLLR